MSPNIVSMLSNSPGSTFLLYRSVYEWQLACKAIENNSLPKTCEMQLLTVKVSAHGSELQLFQETTAVSRNGSYACLTFHGKERKR